MVLGSPWLNQTKSLATLSSPSGLQDPQLPWRCGWVPGTSLASHISTGSPASWSGTPDRCAQCWGRCAGMQLQLVQTQQALGWAILSPSWWLCTSCAVLYLCQGTELPCVLPCAPAVCPLRGGSPGVTRLRRHGSAWALPLPTLALSVAHDPRTVCKMNVRVVPHPV